MSNRTPIHETWLRFESDTDEEPSHEANVIPSPDGYGFLIETSHTAVGQVSTVHRDTLLGAHDYLTAEGFQDFTA